MKLASKFLGKLFVQQWIIGIARCNIRDIVMEKQLSADIKWLRIDQPERFYADPFILPSNNGSEYIILAEDLSFSENYGKISALSLDKDLNNAGTKVLLDTGSHLSYPFVFEENGRTYIIPESSKAGKASCYEYDAHTGNLVFLKDIIEEPLLDSTIIKYKGKYWLFGSQKIKDLHYKLNIYFSDSLFGPYKAHSANPVRTGRDGIRPAGNFFEADGEIYRPAQNNKRGYGDSISLNKLKVLNEDQFEEEFYCTLAIKKNTKGNKGIRAIHTINAVNGIIVVDGLLWRFSLNTKIKQSLAKARSFVNRMVLFL